MKYVKPEVSLFGTATAAMRGVGKAPNPNPEWSTPPPRFTVPAYEADE